MHSKDEIIDLSRLFRPAHITSSEVWTVVFLQHRGNHLLSRGIGRYSGFFFYDMDWKVEIVADHSDRMTTLRQIRNWKNVLIATM